MQKGNILKSLMLYILSESKCARQGHNFYYSNKQILSKVGMLIQNVCWISGFSLQSQVNGPFLFFLTFKFNFKIEVYFYFYITATTYFTRQIVFYLLIILWEFSLCLFKNLQALGLGDGYMSVNNMLNSSSCTPRSVHFFVCNSKKSKKIHKISKSSLQSLKIPISHCG